MQPLGQGILRYDGGVIQTVKVSEIMALQHAGFAIIDVRSAAEFDAGHIPHAVNIPLERLRSNADLVLGPARLLFVCARGVRSLEAANLAIAAGRVEVYSLDGGTQAWHAAGQPLERAVPASIATEVNPASVAPPSATAGAADDGPLDPALDQLIARNLRDLRKQRGWSLDDLARMMNVSRSLLGQIELGNSAPSVAVVWKIARAFDVPFATMLATANNAATSVMRKATAKRLVSPDGRFSSRALFPFEQRAPVEFYELRLGPHSREDAEAHAAGTRENLVVISGQLELEVGAERYSLDEGDAIVFAADVGHAYINRGSRECWMNLVMTYGR